MYSKVIKRCFDFILSLAACVPFLPVYVIVAILIKAEDNGPVFYCGERIGRNGKIFKMYKFRSMKVNAPDIRNEDGSTYNSQNDPRVTKIGSFIRKTSIDELPQILNIVKGDMSIIGPRATLGNGFDTFEGNDIEKLKVRPGLTGYTQAYHRNDISLREKRQKDVWYANNVSFILDIKIFFKTISTVLLRKGLYTNDDKKTEKETV